MLPHLASPEHPPGRLQMGLPPPVSCCAVQADCPSASGASGYCLLPCLLLLLPLLLLLLLLLRLQCWSLSVRPFRCGGIGEP